MDIHPEATGFDLRAAEYEKGRPGYPPGAVALLAEVLGLSAGTTVVDLAAGTGKLTRQLLPTGAHVIAVEPVAGMRHALAGVLPDVEVLEGTAEHIPLPDASADAVTVAQAFHWFRGREALAEVHRVLVPGGRLGLVWNVRDMTKPLQAAYEKVMAPHRGTSPSEATRQWKGAFSETDLFSPLAHKSFSLQHVLTTDELVARALSTSFIARLPTGEQDRVAAQVAALVPAGHETAVMDYSTEVYWSTSLPANDCPPIRWWQRRRRQGGDH